MYPYQDITLLESKIAGLTSQLQACQVRNKDLEQRLLLKSEQLEQVENELESFSFSVSHDLKAPLRHIVGYSDMLKDNHHDQLNEKGNKILNKISSNAKKLQLLIDQLLRISRISNQELKITVVDLDKLVAEAAQEVAETFSHQAQLVIHPLGKAEGDSNLLKLVYQNLLMNALKFSSKKEAPLVEIGVLEKEGTKTYYVKDNGAGFNMAYYERLFAVFQRLHDPEDFEGIGVGLAIVQRILAKHGGKVWAQGRENEGATFYFTL